MAEHWCNSIGELCVRHMNGMFLMLNTTLYAQYTFEITNTTCDPDGGIGNGGRVCLLVNGQYPGPTIFGSKY